MTFDSIDVVFYTLSFVVPGFIAHSVLLAFVPGRQDRTESLLLRFLTLSAFNYAIWSWLIYLLIRSTWLNQHPLPSAVLWLFVILIAPAALGIGLGFCKSTKPDSSYAPELRTPADPRDSHGLGLAIWQD